MHGHIGIGARAWPSRLQRAENLALALALVTVACHGLGSRSSRAGGGTDSSGTRSTIDLATVDVCRRVPAKEVAQALGSQRAETLAFSASADQPSRCRYSVDVGQGQHGARQAYVVMLMPPDQFETRHAQQQNPVTPVSGLGDGAYVTYAPAGERVDLYVLKRSLATIVVSGENRVALIKIAKVAVSHL